MIESEYGYEIIVATVQLLGLLGMVLTRLVSTGKTQGLFQTFFLCWMAFVGVGTLALVHVGCHVWLPLGTTLAVMALGATIDFSRKTATDPF